MLVRVISSFYSNVIGKVLAKVSASIPESVTASVCTGRSVPLQVCGLPSLPIRSAVLAWRGRNVRSQSHSPPAPSSDRLVDRSRRRRHRRLGCCRTSWRPLEKLHAIELFTHLKRRPICRSWTLDAGFPPRTNHVATSKRYVFVTSTEVAGIRASSPSSSSHYSKMIGRGSMGC